MVEDDVDELLGCNNTSASWKYSQKFLFQLGCLRAHGERAPIENLLDMELVISESYTITGYQEGDENLDCLVQLNSTVCLSLTPETVGRVLGLPFRGLPVPQRNYKRQELLPLLLPSARKPPNNLQIGVRVKDFAREDLSDYMLEQKSKLLLQASKTDLLAPEAYCLKEQFFYGVQYNWADYTVRKLKSMLRSQKATNHLGETLKRYVEDVAPLVSRLYESILRTRAPQGYNCAAAVPGHGSVEAPSNKPSRKSSRVRNEPRPDAGAAASDVEPCEGEEPEEGRVGGGQEPPEPDEEEKPPGYNNGVEKDAHSRRRKKAKLNQLAQLESELKKAKDETKSVSVDAFRLSLKYVSLQRLYYEMREEDMTKSMERERREFAHKLRKRRSGST